MRVILDFFMVYNHQLNMLIDLYFVMTEPATTSNTPSKPTRRTQERTEIARANLMNAATPMFAEQGFDAVSVRDIEIAANVKRGMLAYHFGDKDSLWKAVADACFELLNTELSQRFAIYKDLSAKEGLALIIRFHVRFYDRHPELSRLMSQEARQDSWRIRYLVDKHLKPSVATLKGYVTETLPLTEQEFVHWYYIMVCGGATIFSFAPECKLLFGIDPHEENVVNAHAEIMVSMLLGFSNK